jgi:hypothetical protein
MALTAAQKAAIAKANAAVAKADAAATKAEQATAAMDTTPYNPLNSNMYVAATGTSAGTVVPGAPGYVAGGNTGGGNTGGGGQQQQQVPPTKSVSSVITSVNAAGYDVTTTYYSDGTSSSTTSSTLDVGVQGQRQSVFDTVTKLFTDTGLLKTDPATGKLDAVSQSLSDTIKSLAMSGSSQDSVSLALQQTDAYKARFAGNTLRQAAGLNVLDPGTYLALENQYTSILKSAGVPASFYNSPAALGKLIGNDLSPTEVQARADMAVASVQNADPYYTTTLKNYYGLSQGDMVAHLLDPKTATSLLQQQVGSAQIGAEAARQGLSEAAANAQALYAAGVTQAGARTGFGNVAQALPGGQMLSGIYGAQTGINYDQAKAEQQYLYNSGSAALEQQKLIDLEKSQFAGKSGIVGATAQTGYSGSLGKSIQGQF